MKDLFFKNKEICQIFIIVTFLLEGCVTPNDTPLLQSGLNAIELQETIWVDFETGQTNEATTLQNTLYQTLTTGNCQFSGETSTGLSHPLILSCDYGIGGIFKVKRIPFPFEETTTNNAGINSYDAFGFQLTDANSEIAAYTIDQLLNLNIVPMTIRRVFPGKGAGSIQYFVKNTITGTTDESIPGYKKMKILDFIIQNEDRAEGNWLYLPSSNRIVAIDNGKSFQATNQPIVPIIPISTVVNYLQNDSDLQIKIMSIEDQQIIQPLSLYLRDQVIQELLERIHQIQSQFH